MNTLTTTKLAVVRSLALGLAVLLLGSPLRAEVRLVPAQDGHLGAWLLAGPVAAPGAKVEPRSLVPERGQRLAEGLPRWRVVASSAPALNLKKLLGVGRQAGPHAWLGGRLELEQPLTGWLLVSADGGVSIHVDGELLWERDTKRLRGNSWDVVPLRLEAGKHQLLFRLHHSGEHWAFAARILDQELRAPRGASLSLSGTDERDAQRLARELLEVRWRGLGRVQIDYPRGAPLTPKPQVHLVASSAELGGELFRFSAGQLPLQPHGAQAYEISLPVPQIEPQYASKEAPKLEFQVTVGSATLSRDYQWQRNTSEQLERGHALLQRIATRAPGMKLLDPGTAADTLSYHLEEARRAELRPWSRRYVAKQALADLEHLITGLSSGRDPLVEPGLEVLARRSPLDDRPQPLALHIPASFEPGAQATYPLVVVLHGYNGSALRVLRAFLDRQSSQPHPAVDGFVVAPQAHGDAFYRGPGESETLRTIRWMQETYPIDPARVSITGVSMGGTGTAHLALRHADTFSAAAPLCGYQSYFVRRDTSNRPLRPWEEYRMHHWSPASWAKNGRHLPLYVAHGKKDFPLVNSKVLIDAYRKLGYSVTDEWPDIGHSVWEIAYDNAKLWPWLSRKRRPEAPTSLSIETDSLRYARRGWLQLHSLKVPGRMAEAHAKLTPEGVEVTTARVSELELIRPLPKLAKNEPLSVLIDAQRLQYAADEPLRAHRASDQAWQKGARSKPKQHKRAGLEGPIRDAFMGRLAFVYGTLDEATRRANREVAEHFSRIGHGVDIQYPVLPDHALTPELEAQSSLFIVGSARDHRLLQGLKADLPLRVEDEVLYLGQHPFKGKGVGGIAITPSPKAPNHYWVLVQAVDVAGIWRALSLPKLLPDFLIYDAALADAAAQQVLGSARVLAGGFFNEAWQLPPTIGDPEVAP